MSPQQLVPINPTGADDRLGAQPARHPTRMAFGTFPGHVQASESDPGWVAAQKELAAALDDPDTAYEAFKARFRAASPVPRRLRGSRKTAVAAKLHAHRKAAFLANVAHSSAENAKETNKWVPSAQCMTYTLYPQCSPIDLP